MVADTIVIVLVCIKSAQPDKVIPHKQENRFVELFKEADKKFDKAYRLNIDELKRASSEAVQSAAEKTKSQREKALK